MEHSALVRYVRQSLDQGYAEPVIRQHLLAYGYLPVDVELAFQEVHGAPHQGAGVSRAVVMLGFFALLVIAGLVGYLVFLQPPATLLDIDTTPSIVSAEPGDDVPFTLSLSNLGGKKRFDVTVTHELLDPKGKVIATKEESLAIETRTSKAAVVKLPLGVSEGNYKVRTTASYDGRTAVSSFSFQVVQPLVVSRPARPAPATPAQPATPPAETPPEISTPAPAPIPLPAGESTSTLSSREQIEQGTGADDVVSFCETLVDKDRCLATAARKRKDASLCSGIKETPTKDQCYIAVSLAADDRGVCEKIADAGLRESCSG
ncbi:hypothetical protein HY642_07385 [Candidatus Woesearchaeota archaeon]|nr:hypothetical protein [Candidatus Woesearchaeota archaeon]